MFDLNLADTGQPKALSLAEAEGRFFDAAASVGLDTHRLVFASTGGDVLRCDTLEDKRGGKSGWYVIHDVSGLLHGTVGNWQTGASTHFTGRDAIHIDAELLRTMQLQREATKLRVAEEHRLNALSAAERISKLKPCPPDHPYLVRKGIKPHGTLLMGNDLLIPISDKDGNVVSAQHISPIKRVGERDKNFLKACTSLGWRVIGSPTQTVVVAEGFATAASIHELTGLRCYVTFSAKSMPALIEDIAAAEAVNNASIVIAADNDLSKTGLHAAEEAAAKIGATVLMPEKIGDDWNDVALARPADLQAAFAAIRPLFQSWEEIDYAAIPKRQWVYGQIYIRGFCGITVAPGGIGKSTLVLIEAIAMATGRNLLGIQPTGKLKVIYFNAEDPMVEIKLRVAAACTHFGIDQRELIGQLFIQSGRDRDLILASGDPGEVMEGAFTQIEAFLKWHSVDVLIMDPLANLHEAEEDNRTYRKLGKRLSRMAEAHILAVHLVHHTRKLNGMSASVEDSRGGSALIGAVRVARAINPMEPEEAARFGLDTHVNHFRIDGAGKNNLSAPSDKADWFERIGVQMPNDDWCAIVQKWVPPDAFEGVTSDHAKRMQIVLQDAPEPYRESAQSPQWAGNAAAIILELDVEDRAAKARIKSILRQWIASGILATDTWRDKSKGRDHTIVVCGKNLM